MAQYFDISYFWSAFPQLLSFLGVTLRVTCLAVLLGGLLGLLLAFMKLSSSTPLQIIAHLYTTTMRCTPSIVLLFLIYYGIPALAEVLFQISLQNVHTGVFVVTTFSLQFAAVMSEVIRASLLAIPKGQFEAAVSVGLTPRQAYIRIIFPQAFITAIPNIGNAIISVLQEGALAYTIGFIDLVGKANLMIANNYQTHSLEIYLALGLIYWILTMLIDRTFEKIEQKLQYGQGVE